MAPSAGLCQKKTKVEQVRLLRKPITTIAVIAGVIAALVGAQFALIEIGKEVVVGMSPRRPAPFIARGSGSWMMEGFLDPSRQRQRAVVRSAYGRERDRRSRTRRQNRPLPRAS